MSLGELYRELHGEPMPDEVQVRLLKIEKAMGIRDNDALWNIFLAMDYYYRLYLEFPEQIAGKTKEALDEIRKAHQLTINASFQTIREAEAEAKNALAKTVPGIVDRAIEKTRLETLEYALKLKARKWIAIGLTAGILGFSVTGWVFYDRGKSEGYTEAVPVAGFIGHFVNCDEPGWKIGTSKSGDKICSPFPDVDHETYGWKTGGGE